jgi:hypothetical protein
MIPLILHGTKINSEYRTYTIMLTIEMLFTASSLMIIILYGLHDPYCSYLGLAPSDHMPTNDRMFAIERFEKKKMHL